MISELGNKRRRRHQLEGAVLFRRKDWASAVPRSQLGVRHFLNKRFTDVSLLIRTTTRNRLAAMHEVKQPIPTRRQKEHYKFRINTVPILTNQSPIL